MLRKAASEISSTRAHELGCRGRQFWLGTTFGFLFHFPSDSSWAAEQYVAGPDRVYAAEYHGHHVMPIYFICDRAPH